MQDHLLHPRSIHNAIVFCHNGLADIFTPNASLAKAFHEKVGLPVHIFGSQLFCQEMRKRLPFTYETPPGKGLFVVEVGDALDEILVDRIQTFAVKLVLTAALPSKPTLYGTLLPLLNAVDHLPPNEQIQGRVFELDARARFCFPREFDPDHYVSKGDSYFSPLLPFQTKAYQRSASTDTLVMAYPTNGGFDCTLARTNGAYKYRPFTARCFDPSLLPFHSCKLSAVLKNLEGLSLVLTKDHRPMVMALEAAGYRRIGAPPWFEDGQAPNGMFYAVHTGDQDWATPLRTTEHVVVASKGGAPLLNPTQIHVIEPSLFKNIDKFYLFDQPIECRLYLHATANETYPSFENQCFQRQGLKAAIVGDLAMHYALHRDALLNLGAVVGAMTTDVVSELDRLVVDRPTIRDVRGTAGYVALYGATYLFQPDQTGHRFDFENLMENGADEDVAAAFVLERLEFDDCVALLRRAPASRAERAFRRYMLANCWSDPSVYTFWRRDGSLQGIDEQGDFLPGVSKPWTRGMARVRNGALKLLTGQKLTLKQLQAVAESSLTDEAELWFRIELNLRAKGLVLTPLQI